MARWLVACSVVTSLHAVQAHEAGAVHDAAEAAASSGRPSAQVIDPRAGSGAGMSQRASLLDAAERALERGDVAVAALGFERAAMLLHAADTEMGIVRAAMQAGDYRRALAFSAHTAGAHRDAPAAGALYAWLLRIGGQEAYASRVLDETLARSPDDAVVNAARRAFEAPVIEAAGVLLELPHRMAPQAVMQAGQAPPPAAARRVSSGVLIASGQLALVPLAPVEGTRKLWVRNGLGQTTVATQERAPEPLHALGFALLRLAVALHPGATELAPRDAFAGSPGFAIEYAATAAATPAWPVLRQGFLGAFDGAAGMRWLGIELPPGPRGGPVLDASGRLAGIAVPGSDGRAAMLPVSMFRSVAQRAPVDSAPGAAVPPRLPTDEAYERALKTALQVIALR